MLQVTGYIFQQNWKHMKNGEPCGQLICTHSLGLGRERQLNGDLPKSKYQITLPSPIFIRGEAAFNTTFLYWAYAVKLSKKTKVGYIEDRDMLKKSLWASFSKMESRTKNVYTHIICLWPATLSRKCYSWYLATGFCRRSLPTVCQTLWYVSQLHILGEGEMVQFVKTR